MRAIAAMIVVAFHFITFEDENGPLFANSGLRSVANFGSQGVELFYIISGFVIYHSLLRKETTFKTYPVYLKKRFLRIFPPFLATVFLICLTPFIWNGVYPYTSSQIIQNATLSVDLFKDTTWLNPIFATLKVEFLFYLVIGFSVVFMRRNAWIYTIVCGISLISVVFFPTIDIVHTIPLFLIGIACSEIYKSHNAFLNYSILVASLMLLAFLFPLEDLIIAICSIVLLLWLKIKSKWLEKIGEFSYSLYLVHGLSGGLALYLCKTQKVIALNPWITLFIAFSVALGSAYLFFLIIEKRAIRWSKKG